jgi:hypothetical protein
MKKNLLELVQQILLELESDEVNDINDTVEAEQVANIIRTAYYDILNRRTWPFMRRVIALESPGTNETPAMLHLADDVTRIDVVRYNRKGGCGCDHDDWKRITYLRPEDFLDYVLRFDESCSNVEYMPLKLGDNAVCTLSDNFIKIKNDSPPNYWTSFDDEWLVFDSYCSEEEDTLTNTNSLAWGVVLPAFEIEDTFVPDLPGHMFTLLEQEATALAFYNLKGIAHQKHAADMRKGWIRLQKSAWRENGSPKKPNVGR